MNLVIGGAIYCDGEGWVQGSRGGGGEEIGLDTEKSRVELGICYF